MLVIGVAGTELNAVERQWLHAMRPGSGPQQKDKNGNGQDAGQRQYVWQAQHAVVLAPFIGKITAQNVACTEKGLAL